MEQGTLALGIAAEHMQVQCFLTCQAASPYMGLASLRTRIAMRLQCLVPICTVLTTQMSSLTCSHVQKSLSAECTIALISPFNVKANTGVCMTYVCGQGNQGLAIQAWTPFSIYVIHAMMENACLSCLLMSSRLSCTLLHQVQAGWRQS